MAKKVLAFDIGGTSIRAAVVENNKIKKLVRCSTPKTKKEFLERIDGFAKELLTKDIKGIGVGCAGLIKDGIVCKSPNLPLKSFDFKGYLIKKYKRKVEIFNDAGCFSLAEQRLGARKKDFFIITLGTGIGGGIIINGEPYSGGNGVGGELGHTYVNGVDFESLWKGTRRRIKKEFGRDILFRELVNMNNLKSRRILSEAADYLGKGIASLVSAFDPEVVILAGGPSESGRKFSFMIEKKVREYEFFQKKVSVRWTKLKQPGILGASLLVS